MDFSSLAASRQTSLSASSAGVLKHFVREGKRVDHGGTEGTEARAALDDSSYDRVSEDYGVEVDEEADAEATEFQVGQQLGFVSRDEFFDGFDFQHDLFLNHEIEAVTALEVHAFILNGKLDFLPKPDPLQVKLAGQATLVGGLEEPRPEQAVDFYGRSNDPLGQILFD